MAALLPSLLLLLLACLAGLATTSLAIVVDGDKKQDMSPKRVDPNGLARQIDQFNVKTCGISDTDYSEHEFVNMARRGEFPWLVSFQIKLAPPKRAKGDTDLHFCAGSLISDRWVLSAAHCFKSDSMRRHLESGKIGLVAGSPFVSASEQSNRRLTISRVFYHDKFSADFPIGFDIALVELGDPVEFSQRRPPGQTGLPFMNAICLPKANARYKFNETARIAGWGQSSAKDASSAPSKLLFTDILLSDTKDCATKYAKATKSDRPGKQLQQYDDFVCASYKKTRDACQSDSGGPLTQFANGKAIAIGIVSYGIGCAKQGIPGLYTRTSAYLNWIKDVAENGEAASVGFVLINAGRQKDALNKTTTTTTDKPASPLDQLANVGSSQRLQTKVDPVDALKRLASEPTTETTQKHHSDLETAVFYDDRP